MPPNTQELLDADGKLWNTVSDLVAQQFSLEDAVTVMRGDIGALLQPRPKPLA